MNRPNLLMTSTAAVRPFKLQSSRRNSYNMGQNICLFEFLYNNLYAVSENVLYEASI